MTPDLSTFAKVRALHDRTDSPGEKAAAAGRMEALARAAGMSVAEAVSRVDAETSRTAAGADWSAFTQGFADAFRETEEAFAAANGPDAPCRRRGLPIYDPNKVECWRDVAEHCWQLDWIIPKAHGGKFLTKAERARLKALARHYGSVKNSTADWIETVLARCEAARQSWRDRGKDGVRPDRKATESDIEKAAELIAAAKRREASKLDEPQEAPAGPRNFFEDLFNSPEFKARDAERERERAARRAAALAEHGSEDAVFADTDREAALRRACAPLTVWDERPEWRGCYTLAGWSDDDGKQSMPASVREAAAEGWPYPETVAAAWVEYEAAEALDSARYAFDPDYNPHQWVRARSYVLEDALNTMPARSLHDLRARMTWLEHLSKLQVQWTHNDDLIRYATLRADIERVGVRLREQDAAPVQNGRCGDGVANLHPIDGEGSAPSAYPLRSPDSGTASPGVREWRPQGGSGSLPPSPAEPDGLTDRDPTQHGKGGGFSPPPLTQGAARPAHPLNSPELATSNPVQSGRAEGYSQSEHPVRRTNADKRRDVLALLDADDPGIAPLTDREIARRAGVSPTTVGTIRRAHAARPASP